MMDLSRKGENGSRVCEPAETKEKAAEEGGTRRGRIQLEPSGTSADKAISGKDVPTEWHDRTNRAVFNMARASPERRYGEV